MALFRMKPHYRKRGGTLSKYGTAPNLSTPCSDLAATSVGNYALFGGGYQQVAYSNLYKDTVVSYNSSLIKSNLSSLSTAREILAATSVGNYALFGGGWDGSAKDTIDVYDTQLTKVENIASLVSARYDLAATSVGNYALFGGGRGAGTKSDSNRVDCYNNFLTHSATYLTISKTGLAATSVGNYALFGGGQTSNSGAHTLFNSATVDAYNASLSRVVLADLTSAAHSLAATSVGNYALFGGGFVGETYVNAYDSSLTKISNIQNFTVARRFLASASIGDYAIFGGGYDGTNTLKSVDVYDAQLTKVENIASLVSARYDLAATSVGNYALFGGGWDGSAYSDTVDVYQVT